MSPPSPQEDLSMTLTGNVKISPSPWRHQKLCVKRVKVKVKIPPSLPKKTSKTVCEKSKSESEDSLPPSPRRPYHLFSKSLSSVLTETRREDAAVLVALKNLNFAFYFDNDQIYFWSWSDILLIIMTMHTWYASTAVKSLGWLELITIFT